MGPGERDGRGVEGRATRRRFYRARWLPAGAEADARLAISALVWVVCASCSRFPGESFIPDLVVVGLIAAGGLFLLSLLTFHREALETESPGLKDP
jgi:hypothetical protein